MEQNLPLKKKPGRKEGKAYKIRDLYEINGKLRELQLLECTYNKLHHTFDLTLLYDNNLHLIRLNRNMVRKIFKYLRPINGDINKLKNKNDEYRYIKVSAGRDEVNLSRDLTELRKNLWKGSGACV